jgi:hypothetical protein
MAINGVSSGLTAIQRQAASMDRAAEKIAKSSITDVSQAPTNAAEAEAIGAQESGMVDGTVEMMVAKRMFSAALKMAATANEGIMEALRIGDYDSAQAA